MKVWLIVLGIILIVVGLAVFFVAFIVSGFDLPGLGTSKTVTNTYPVTEPFRSIDVRSESAEIAFRISEDGNVRVVCTELENAKNDVRVEDGTLKIGVKDERKWYEFLSFSGKKTSTTVYLPAGEYEKIFVESGTGDVSLPESFSFASIDLRASTGDVVCGASASGSVALSASTGDIRLKGIRAGSVSLTVSTGKIEADGITCDETVSVNVSTGRSELSEISCRNFASEGSTGRLVMKNVVASETMNLKRQTGDISLDRCDAGEIRIDLSTGDVEGTLRTEKVFSVKTSTGKCDVPNTTSGGRCDITTSTGDVRIRIAEN